MTNAISMNGLTKHYQGVQALTDLTLGVPAGSIYGFIGPNGSGKTTTLRTLLGLIRPNGGRMALLGREVPAHLPEVAGSVGAIVESPQFFGNFTARDTLVLLADAGGVDPARVHEVLELVGLRDRAGDRVKTYSLGMKQRLAVASALLKNPRLLILDEPANGLDPGGIREMRTLMRNLAESGMTVVLSSHILGEIQLICDSVTIISAGRRVAAGGVADVLAQHASSAVRVRIEAVTDLTSAAATLRDLGARVVVEPDHLMVSGIAQPGAITRALAARGVYVTELAPVTVDLESVFLELTGTTPVDGAHRQVDESATAGAATAPGGWGQ
jgi:ABC-2 type transport system ATP-binding protein